LSQIDSLVLQANDDDEEKSMLIGSIIFLLKKKVALQGFTWIFAHYIHNRFINENVIETVYTHAVYFALRKKCSSINQKLNTTKNRWLIAFKPEMCTMTKENEIMKFNKEKKKKLTHSTISCDLFVN
jgi:hypothetical protein